MINFQTNREKAIWIAALVDGEGTLRFMKHKQFGLRYYPMLAINNTNIEILEMAMQVILELTSNIKVRGLYEPRLNSKQSGCYMIVVQNMPRLQELLPQLEPFLIIKKKKCQLIIHWLSIQLSQKRPHNYEYTQEQKSIIEEVCRLNKRRRCNLVTSS